MRSLLARAALLVGALTFAGCPDPVDVPDAGTPVDAGGPPPDAGTPGTGRVRAVGLGTVGGTATGAGHTIRGEIGRPTSNGRAMGPSHTIVGGVGQP